MRRMMLLGALFLVFGVAAGREDPFEKGREHYLAGRFEIALVTLLDAVKTQPENADCYLYIGNVYTHKREFGKAAAYYRIGLDLAKKPAVFLFNLGQAMYYDGKYDEAVATFGKAWDADRSLVDTWLDRGRAYYLLSDRPNTIKSWRTYLEVAPNNPQAETIRKALALLADTNFLFPAERKKLEDRKLADEDARKQALRDKLAAMLQGGGQGTNVAATNARPRVLTDRDVQTSISDVTNGSKPKADYDKGEDIEK